ncbi:MAG: hypothetical protein WBM14_03505 [Terracidiphilus sp.]
MPIREKLVVSIFLAGTALAGRRVSAATAVDLERFTVDLLANRLCRGSRVALRKGDGAKFSDILAFLPGLMPLSPRQAAARSVPLRVAQRRGQVIKQFTAVRAAVEIATVIAFATVAHSNRITCLFRLFDVCETVAVKNFAEAL